MNSLRRTIRRPRRRGTTLLEFVMVAPIFIFLMLFSVDMGRLALLSSSLSDATFAASRAGAAYGLNDEDPNDPLRQPIPTGTCENMQTAEQMQDAPAQGRRMQLAFCQRLLFAPGVPGPDRVGLSMVSNDGTVYVEEFACGEDGQQFVRTEGRMAIGLITPGLGGLLNLTGPINDEASAAFIDASNRNSFLMTSRAVSRCEVERL